MASHRIRRAAFAAVLSLFAQPAFAQALPDAAPPSPAAMLWQLRSGLNVAALACRGPAEAGLVAGYNRLLSDHRAEFAAAYTAVSHEYANAAAFDAAMTKLYNRYAQPGTQAALCVNAQGVLDRLAAGGPQPLQDAATTELAALDERFALPAGAPATQLAVASIPHILVAVPAAEQGDPYDDGD